MRKTKKTKNSGFTLVETIIVIAIIGLVGFTTFVFLNGTRSKGILREAQAALIGALETVRSYAINGVGSSGTENYKIQFNSNKISILEGSNEIAIVFLPSGISINSALSEILFKRIRGETNLTEPLIIQLTHSITGATTSITVSPEGKIQE